jgi:hypothetical protein
MPPTCVCTTEGIFVALPTNMKLRYQYVIKGDAEHRLTTQDGLRIAGTLGGGGRGAPPSHIFIPLP